MSEWFYEDLERDKPFWWWWTDSIPFIYRRRRIDWYSAQTKQMQDKMQFFVNLWMDNNPYCVELSRYPWACSMTGFCVAADHCEWVKAHPEVTGTTEDGAGKIFTEYPGRGWKRPTTPAPKGDG